MAEQNENMTNEVKFSSHIIAYIKSDELKKLFILLDECNTPYACAIANSKHKKWVKISCYQVNTQYFLDLVNTAKEIAKRDRQLKNEEHVSE